MVLDSETTRVSKINVLLKICARFSAWVLLAGVVVLILSGFGITQTGVIYRLSGGLIDRRIADQIHRASNVPLAFFFLSHVFINIHVMLTRRGSLARKWLSGIIFLIIGLALMAGMIYMEYFRRGG
jgi:hypothetical protein